MVIVCSLILPHGAMTFDGDPNPTGKKATERVSNISETQRQDCHTLFTSCTKAVELAKATSPDVIFLNTPHGICLSDTFGVYLNPNAKGNAEWNNQWKEFEVEVTLDSELAGKMIEHLRSSGIAVEGINAFTGHESPLRWGEVVPLWFLKQLTEAGIKVVIFSNPRNQMRGPSLLSEESRIGASVATFLRGLEQRVLYVVSGDLAHRHETDCQLPLYLPDPRWTELRTKSDTSLPFDFAIENWLKGAPFSDQPAHDLPLKSKEETAVDWDAQKATEGAKWLSKAISLKGSANSCGIYGFGILHGLLVAEMEAQGARFRAHFWCRLAPTYYGMAVAAFVRE